MVSKVADGGPASKNDGLKAQDVILKVWFGNLPNFTRKGKPFSRAWMKHMQHCFQQCLDIVLC